jgi:transcriptional regulator with XRE-family HTH domain
VGNRIKELRKKLGITQSDLAKKIGIQRGSVASYEIGRTKPSHSNLEKISKIFNISLDFLLKGDEKENCPNSANFISILGNEVNIEPRKYDICTNLIPVHSSVNTDGMYAIKITSTEMYPQIEKNNICLCVYDEDQPIKENMIVHYAFKEKNGIRVIKIDEETNQISLVPLNLEKHKIITIPSKELHLLKTAKIIRLIRDL